MSVRRPTSSDGFAAPVRGKNRLDAVLRAAKKPAGAALPQETGGHPYDGMSGYVMMVIRRGVTPPYQEVLESENVSCGSLLDDNDFLKYDGSRYAINKNYKCADVKHNLLGEYIKIAGKAKIAKEAENYEVWNKFNLLLPSVCDHLCHVHYDAGYAFDGDNLEDNDFTVLILRLLEMGKNVIAVKDVNDTTTLSSAFVDGWRNAHNMLKMRAAQSPGQVAPGRLDLICLYKGVRFPFDTKERCQEHCCKYILNVGSTHPDLKFKREKQVYLDTRELINPKPDDEKTEIQKKETVDWSKKKEATVKDVANELADIKKGLVKTATLEVGKPIPTQGFKEIERLMSHPNHKMHYAVPAYKKGSESGLIDPKGVAQYIIMIENPFFQNEEDVKKY